MERKIGFLQRLPEIYSTVREFQALAQSMDGEFEQIAQDNRQDLEDSFILQAPAERLSIWEKEIGIRADPQRESTEFRRQRLINRYTTRPPFTMNWLKKQLDMLLGAGNYRLGRDENLQTLKITAGISAGPLLQEFQKTLENTVPLSMGLEISTAEEGRWELQLAFAQYEYEFITNRQVG